MKTTIEIELEESLLEEVDETAAILGVSRTVYITVAVKHALRFYQPKELGEQDEINTFLLWLADDDDVDGWPGARDWGDPWEWPDDNRLN